MKKMRRLLTCFLVVILVTTLFAGCAKEGDEGEPTTKPTETAKVDETEDPGEITKSPVDIINFFRARWWPDVIDEGSGWEDSAVYKHIQEQTGISYHFEVPAAAEAEVLGTMIASKTYPDMISFGSHMNPYIQQMKEAGLIYSITELAKEHAPALLTDDLITPTLRANFQDENEELWFYVGFEGDDTSVQAYLDTGFVPTSGENILYVRKDILNAWGKNDLTNWEDLNDLLRFTHENYPDVDSIKLDASSDLLNGYFGRHFLSAFGTHLTRTMVDTENEQLLYIMKDPNAVNYVKWLNSLYKEGIITDTMLADDTDTVQSKTMAGDYGMIISSTFNASNTINTTIETNDGNDDRVYRALSQVSYEDKDYFQVETIKNKGAAATVITKNCENPDRAIQLIEYFLTEDGQATGTLGVEGEHWQWEGDQQVLLPENLELLSTNLVEYVAKSKTIGSFTNFARQASWARYVDNYLTPTGPTRDEHNLLMGPYLTEIWNHGFIQIKQSIASGSEMETINTQINEVQLGAIPKMVAAKDDAEFNNLLESLLSDLEGLGLSKLEQHWTQEYLKNCENLGLTPWEVLDSKVDVMDVSGLSLIR